MDIFRSVLFFTQQQLEDLPKIYVPPRIQSSTEPEQKSEEKASEEKPEKEAVPSLNSITRETNKLMEVFKITWLCHKLCFIHSIFGVFFFLSLCVTWCFISDERGRVQAQRNYLG